MITFASCLARTVDILTGVVSSLIATLLYVHRKTFFEAARATLRWTRERVREALDFAACRVATSPYSNLLWALVAFGLVAVAIQNGQLEPSTALRALTGATALLMVAGVTRTVASRYSSAVRLRPAGLASA